MDDPFAQFDDWAKPVVAKDPFAEFEDWAKKAPAVAEKPSDPFPDQSRRYEEAKQWAVQSGGGDQPIDRVMGGIGLNSKKQGPFGIRPRDIAMPFQGAITALGRAVTGGKSDAQKMKDAEEARDKGEATDEQLARLAIREYEQNRNQQIGASGRIAQGVAQAPAIVAEAMVGGAAVKAAGKGIGLAKVVDGAKTPLGIGLQSAGVQAAATPITPGLWLKEAEQRQAENGGYLLDPKNAGLPMFRAAFTNAIMGHLGVATKGKGVVRGLGVQAAALPAEQAFADVAGGAAEDAFVKLGMPEKMKTETGYGTFGMLASGKYGEAMEKVAVEAILSTIVSRMQGRKTDQVALAKDAFDSLAKDGVPAEKAPEILKQALSDPQKAPEGPVRDFAEAMKPPEPVKSPVDPNKAPEVPKPPPEAAKPEPGPESLKPEIAPETKPQEPEAHPETVESVDDVIARIMGEGDRRKSSGTSPEGAERRQNLTLGRETPVTKSNVRASEVGDFDSGRFGENHFRVEILNDVGKPIGQIRVGLEGDTIHLPTGGQDNLRFGEGRGKGNQPFKEAELLKLATQLAERFPNAKKIQYKRAPERRGTNPEFSTGELRKEDVTIPLSRFRKAAEPVKKGIGKKPPVETPPEPTAPEPEVNSIKNEATEAERARTGMPPRAPVDIVGHSFPELRDQVADIAQKDPGRADRLVEELKANPRRIADDLEDAILLRRQVDLKLAHRKAKDAVVEAQKSGDPAAIVEAENIREAAYDKYREAMEINEAAGTLQGRALGARRMMMRDDYSLENLTYQREKTLGRKLNEAEMAQVEALSKKLEDVEARLDALQKAAAEKPTVAKVEIGKRTKAARSEVDAAWEELRAATKGKLFSVEAAFGEAIVPAAKLAKAYIKLGVAKFSDFVEAVRLKSGKPLTPEAERILKRGFDDAQAELAAEKRDQRIESGTEKLKAKLEAGDVDKPIRKDPPRSKETNRLEAERRQVVAEINQMRLADERAQEGVIKRNLRRVWEVASLQRGIFLGLDLPPLLRQAGFVSLGHPVMAAKAFAKTVKAFRSDLKSQEVMAEIASRDNAKNGAYKRDMNLELSDLHSQDEFVQSSYLKKIPVFSGLQRWHSAFLTKLRADLYDSLSAGLSKTGTPTAAEGAIIGNAVNVFTGKGNLGRYEQAVGSLNNVFLAPKWVVSRFQTASLQPLRFGAAKHGMQAQARKAVAKEYARMLAGVATVYGLVSLAKAAGAQIGDVETDTTSADFGEIRIGNTRLNPLAGLSQVIRFVSRLGQGEQQVINTKKDGTEVKSRMPTRMGDTAASEFRKKLAPIPSNVWTGTELYRKSIGKGKGPPKPYPQSAQEQAIEGLVPLTPQEIKKAIDDLGLPGGVAVGLWAMIGGGAKTYDRK